ncbi:zincin-like metallopeptidase domain-containing protein, partial [Erythrobacter donghaensis]|uniref:zincin-like metallopeptidase domain-containing protein n=2 Tax=Erythrobacter donghaensis TaxID=267135 RepID=UPI0022AAE144
LIGRRGQKGHVMDGTYHELSHWTGHASRLGRDLKSRFGTAAYAAEELVALSGQSAPCLTHHRTVCSWHNAGGHQAG